MGCFDAYNVDVMVMCRRHSGHQYIDSGSASMAGLEMVILETALSPLA